MITIKNLAISFQGKTLFSPFNQSIQWQDKIAIAGRNGMGKSTLIKCLAGINSSIYDGEIITRKDISIGYLPQEGIYTEGRSLFDEVVASFFNIAQIEQQLATLEQQLAVLDSSTPAYAIILEKLGFLDLQKSLFSEQNMAIDVEKMLLSLGFNSDEFSKDCGTFSGGWQMRIAMAKLFLGSHDLLLMDEPTNHLDLHSQIAVEKFLKKTTKALCLICHDTHFLDNITKKTWAIENQTITNYSGNYSFYLTQAAAHREQLRKKQIQQQKERKKIQDFVDRFRATASKAAQVQSRIKQLAKMEEVTLIDEQSQMQLAFAPPLRAPQQIITLQQTSKHYDAHVILDNYDWTLEKGQKWAVVGDNGTGKSTFFRLLANLEQPDCGRVNYGNNATISLYNQNLLADINPEQTILEVVEQQAANAYRKDVRTILGCFLFTGDDVLKQIKVLSGGEKARVALVCMLLRPANVLLLDEPTNHLDAVSQQILQQALINYQGTCLIVSHNRQFLDPIVDRTLVFSATQNPATYHGNVSYYLAKKVENISSSDAISTPQIDHIKKPTTTNVKKEKSKKEKRQIEAKKRAFQKEEITPLQQQLITVENAIANLESWQENYLTQLANKTPDFTSQQQKYTEKIAQLNGYYSDWDKISTLLEKKQEMLTDFD